MTKKDGSESWQFLNFNQPKQHTDKDVRRLVRSNAQRAFRFSQKQAKLSSGAVERASLQQIGRTADAVGLTKPFCSSCGARVPRAKGSDGSPLCCSAISLEDLLRDTRINASDTYSQGSPLTLLGAACIDPFHALPIESNVRYNCEMLSHCRTPLSSYHIPNLFSQPYHEGCHESVPSERMDLPGSFLIHQCS